MTTIAWRPDEIAGDTAIFENNTIIGHMTKVIRASLYTLAGGAGTFSEVLAFLEWVKKGGAGQWPKLNDETTCIVGYERTLYVYDATGRTKLVNCPYYAIGGGGDFATGALAYGASAKEAVKIAMKHDAFTAGRVVVRRAQ